MNIDKTRKVVSIVLMVLMIGTMVFNAFHIVGHCADDSSSTVTEFPLPFGLSSGYGFTPEMASTFSGFDFSSILATANASNNNAFDTIVLVEYTNANDFILGCCNSSWLVSVNTDSFTTGTKISWGSGSSQITKGVRFQNGSWNYSAGNYWGFQINIGSKLVSLPIGGYSFPNDVYTQWYPLYSQVDSISTSLGTVLFTKYSPDPDFGGHSKGGTITDYTFDQTDETAPTDPSAVAGSGGWLSKILGGLNKLNKTVGDGFKNLVDNLQSFFNPIFGAFEQQIDSFKSSVESKLDDIILALGGDLDTSDTSLSDTFLTAFQGSKSYGVVTTYNQGKQLVTGLFNAVPTPTTLRFEFDLPTMNLSGGHSQGGSSGSNAVKPYGNKLVMDFGWYENVRSIVVPFIIAWLYAGMLIWILRAIPGFISGSPSFNTRSISDGRPIVTDSFHFADDSVHLSRSEDKAYYRALKSGSLAVRFRGKGGN